MSPVKDPGFESIEDTRKRITARTINWLTEHFHDLRSEDLANILGAGESTVKRWKKGESRPNDNHFSQIRQLIEMKDLLQQLYGENEQHLDEWMYNKSKLLDDQMPYDVLKEKGKLDPVVKQLSSLVTGSHT